MAVFRAQVFFNQGTAAKWSNVYHLVATTLPIARDSTLTMLPFLRDLLNTACNLRSILVSDLANDDFSEVVHNVAGTDTGAGTLLPFFNSIKFLIQPANLGRADIKFIKGLLTEDVHTSGTVGVANAAAYDEIFQDMIDAMITNTTPLCSQDGALWETVSVQPAVQMRQMHRRRRPAA